MRLDQTLAASEPAHLEEVAIRAEDRDGTIVARHGWLLALLLLLLLGELVSCRVLTRARACSRGCDSKDRERRVIGRIGDGSIKCFSAALAAACWWRRCWARHISIARHQFLSKLSS